VKPEASKPAPAKTARRRARELALQALYAWQIAGGELSEALDQLRGLEGWDRADQKLADALVRGVVTRADQLQSLIAPCLDNRAFSQLAPVERAILYAAACEFSDHRETPFKVVMNEAIELGKSFGGTDGHRFVNGVLEKLARTLRPEEAARAKQTA
jgi:N utilization substance protein B